jgi:hypothetical protein
LQTLGPWGPLFFGIGFIAPLLATLMDSASIALPHGLTHIQAGLAIGAAWGLYAKFRGRWI